MNVQPFRRPYNEVAFICRVFTLVFLYSCILVVNFCFLKKKIKSRFLGKRKSRRTSFYLPSSKASEKTKQLIKRKEISISLPKKLLLKGFKHVWYILYIKVCWNDSFLFVFYLLTVKSTFLMCYIFFRLDELY